MGEGQFGGDGSVKWEIDNSNDDPGKFNHVPPGVGNPARKVIGVDTTYGPDFVVSLRPPTPMTAAQFKTLLETGGLTIVGNRVELRVPIEDGVPRQVVVSWAEERSTTT
jgi:hypothetical protein